ncbi:MAG: MmgE/PrpD family protein, partial [Pseudomonadota bacterium]
FSYAFLAAMVLAGVQTEVDDAYSDAACQDAALVATAQKVTVRGTEAESDTSTTVTVTFASGESATARHDLAAPMDDAALVAGLRGKARGLLGEAEADQLWRGAVEGGAADAAQIAAMLKR